MPTIANQLPPIHFPVATVQAVPIEVYVLTTSVVVEVCGCVVASTSMSVATPALWGRWASSSTICTMAPNLDRPGLRTATTVLGARTPS